MINQKKKNIFLYLNVINISKDPIDTDLEQIEEDCNTASQYRLVDDYVIQDGQTHQFAVVVPGGGYYLVASFIEGKPIAKRLNSKGITAFIVYYRTKDETKFPSPIDDLSQAIRYILKYIDKDNYSISEKFPGRL